MTDEKKDSTPMPSEALTTSGSMRYYCADGRRIAEGHDTEQCPPCLRAQRDGIMREHEARCTVVGCCAAPDGGPASEEKSR